MMIQTLKMIGLYQICILTKINLKMALFIEKETFMKVISRKKMRRVRIRI